ncbi:MAG TPA: cellulase family glycosylhydrolase, partial [Nitrososphaerales archaeon]|nr:cellulase family glycosylhydrolase [Nitrososphaerales archaeon]
LGGGLVRVFFVNSSYYFAGGTCQQSYFDDLTTFLGWVQAAGLRAIINVGIAVNSANTNASEQAFGCFATRYQGNQGVYLWELTNEPDQSGHWNSTFWGRLKTVYDSVKAQDPTHEVTVAIGYGSSMAQLCQQSFVPDVPQYHEYSPWGGPSANATFLSKVEGDIQQVYDACGHRPVLIGETGMPSAPSSCGLPSGCSETLQSEYLDLVMRAVAAKCGEVAGALVWTLTDFPAVPGAQGHYGVYAVVNGTYAAKPSAGVVGQFFKSGFSACAPAA